MKNIINISIINLLFIAASLPATAQLNEGFEGSFPPPGWAVANNGIGLDREWEQKINPAASNSGNNHAYVRFENVTGGIAEDWLITPAITPTDGDNTLTFYAKSQVAGNDFSLYTVRVSTSSQSDLGAFDIVATYDESQIIDASYTQFTVDLSFYNDLEIYVAFVMENDFGDSFLLDDVVGPALVVASAPPNCDAQLLAPLNNATDVSINTKLIWSIASGNATGYNLRIGTGPGLSNFLSQNVGSVNEYTINNFAYNQDYYVTITPYNTAGNADAGDCMEYMFTTLQNPNITLDCAGAGTPISRTVCYGDITLEEFVVTSNNGSQVQLTFNAGTLENFVDEIYIYDGVDHNGTLLNSTAPYGNEGNLAGFSYVSSTGSIFVRITPDGNNSCASSDQTALNYTATCISCNPPVGTAALGDCLAGSSQFYIDVNLTSLGDGTVIISNDQNANTETVTNLGTTPIGPFNYGTVTLTLEHNTDANCNIDLLPITVSACPPINNDCGSAISLDLSGNNNCVNAENGSTELTSPSIISGLCTADNNDLWYSFMPSTSGSYIFELSNLAAFTSLAIYSGDCNGLTLLSDECFGQESATVVLTENVTYYIQVFANDENQAGNFDLCVFAAPPPPANDLCGNATALTGDIMNEDASFATTMDAVNCSSNPIGQGVWYQFTAINGYLDFTIQPDDWDAEIQLWSGANCQNLSCLMQMDAGTTGALESIIDYPTTSGTIYYLYVGSYAANFGAGTFDLTFSNSALLSVNLLSFQGIAIDKTNQLTWATANETNLVNHTVERSLDGLSSWTKIGSLAARNQANQQYVFIDENPLKTGYYRLISQDNAGKTALSNIISIERDDQGSVQVFPIPTANNVTVQYYAPSEDKFTLTIRDLTGREVYVQKVEVVEGINQMEISLMDLVNGIYILTVDNNIAPINTRIVKK